MKKILCGLCFGFLLACPAFAYDLAGIEVKTLVRAGSSWDGAVLPPYLQGEPEITILRITIPPQAILPLHKHPMINAGVMLRGTLKVTTDMGKTLILGEGDALIEVVDTWHTGKNEGMEPAEIIVFYTGITGKPISVKQDEAH